MRNVKLLVCLLASTFLIESCYNDDIIYPEANIEVAKKYLGLGELASNPVEVSNEDGTYVLKIVSEKKWKVTSSESWCNLPTTEGFKYVEVPIKFSQNPWNVKRTAHLTFTVPETEEAFVLEVTQEASETKMAIDKEALEYGVGGGEQSVILKTNANDWSVKVVDVDGNIVNWCAVNTDHGQGNAELKFRVEGNSTGSIRKANILFTAADTMLQLPVSQLETFEAPAVALVESATLNLNWDEVAGINKYELKITDSNGAKISGVDNIVLDPAKTTYNLSTINWGNYVGKIKVQLLAVMMINNTPITKGSEILETHNYFDYSSGNGTAASPYVITKARHLINVGKFLNKENVYFKQNADIDLTGINFEPINNKLESNEYKGEFKGVYDAGKGNVIDNNTKRTSDKYKISNLTFSKLDKSSCGLFAKIGTSGIVRNLCLVNPVLEGFIKVGGIAGETSGTILNCEISGSSENSKIYAKGNDNAYLGGISGNMLEGEIAYCVNRCNVKGESGSVGGIVGNVTVKATNPAKISYCSNLATVNSDIKSPIGGIVGNVGGSGDTGFNIGHCYNQGNVSGNNANNQVGGIIGRVNFKTMVYACQNDGSVTANGSAGGIVGRMGGNSSAIENCSNAGVITSTGGATNGNSNAAGILATCQGPSIAMRNCLNSGVVSAAKDTFLNGIFNRSDKAANNIQMSACYAIDKDNVRQTNISDGNIKQGESLSYTNIVEANAVNPSTFKGWDFANVWEVVNGKYPTIKGLLK